MNRDADRSALFTHPVYTGIARLPVMDRRALSRDDARRVYNRIGEWQDTQSFYEDPALDALITQGDFQEASTIFEVGCGTGRLAERLLRDHCLSDARYVGVDLSPRMVGIARSRLEPFADRAEVCLTDGGFDFALADDSQDRVVATYVLDLLSAAHVRAVLAEAHRLLSPSGRLCLAGLTRGESVLGRLISSLWWTVHAIRPEWVGGCRPLRMDSFLDEAHWKEAQRTVVRGWGVPSEVLVASPKK